METGKLSPFGKGVFNTSAQKRTASNEKSQIIINGKGSDLSNANTTQGRAKRKMISQVLVLQLIDIAKENNDVKMQKKFWNTYHCLNEVFEIEGRMYGNYCKNRICLVCQSIRKAVLIEKYLPIVKNWSCPHFVTLTCKTVHKGQLKALMKNVNKGFDMIIEKYRKRYKRGKGIRFMGISSFECNFNPQKGTYNPHFHILVPDLETAQILVHEWLDRPRKKIRAINTVWTHIKGQNVKQVTNLEMQLIELIKYSTKIFTELDIYKKIKHQEKRKLYARAIYNILKAFDRTRLFDRFGFDLPKDNPPSPYHSQVIKDFKKYSYCLEKHDWVNITTTERLSDYQPALWLRTALEKYIDVNID